MADVRVAVIGGGYAGMAAAVELADAGVPVEVFEAAPRLGGRARAIDWQGRRIDSGQHILLGAYRETLRLMARVRGGEPEGLLRQGLRLSFPGSFDLRAPRLPAPWHLAAALASVRGLSFGARFRAVRFMQSLQATGFRLPRDRSVAELLRQHRQHPDACRYLWEPLCLAALNTPPDTASAQVFVNVLRDGLARDRADSDMLLPTADLATLLPERAARWVAGKGGAVHTSAPVRRVARVEGGFRLTGEHPGAHRVYSHVICAASPWRLPDLVAGLPEMREAAQAAEALAYEPICTLYLRYPASTGLPAPILGLIGGFGQWAFDQGQLCGIPGLLAVVISARGAHERLSRDDLVKAIHAELAEAFGVAEQPLAAKVIAERRATFACTVGLARPAQLTPLSRFYLAGDYTAGDYPATLEAAVQSGLKCATYVLEASASG